MKIITIKKLIPVLVTVGLYYSCAPVAYRPAPPVQSPVIRVGLIEGRDSLTFSSENALVLYVNGRKQGLLPHGRQYTLLVQDPGTPRTEYRVQYAEYPDRSEAERMKRKLQRYGIKSRVEKTGSELVLGRQKLKNGLSYLLYDQRSWEQESEALQYVKRLRAQNARVVAVSHREGSMKIESGDRQFPAMGNVTISGGRITVKNVPVGHGYHWSRMESRTYDGELDIQIGDTGHLTVINVLPLSRYLEGVLPGEMPVSFPLEALKAQAIAARTYFLHNYSRVHKSKSFDVCDDVHCQSYIGVSDNEKIKKAVRETHGQVLQINDELCNTPYCAMCGGHTEHAQNVWSGEVLPYLSGLFDAEHARALENAMDLSQERDLERWLQADPNVFCNIEKSGDPEFAQYAKKFFRWSEQFTREELEQSIRKYTGKDFGTLVDLIPLSRGVSGRIIELEVIGTSRTFTIKKELNIRKALSAKTLYSACFIIEPLGSVNDVYKGFKFTGAGWGHGVGMCQIGAACMAHRGKPAERILEHYYQGARVVTLY